MYLRSLTVKNLKLLKEQTIDFSRDGQPRKWTVLIGENGTCKTSLLQAIALAASGAQRANQMADVPSLRDRRQADASMRILATFSFSQRHHQTRRYPGIEEKRPQEAPSLEMGLKNLSNSDLLSGLSYYWRPDNSIIISSPKPMVEESMIKAVRKTMTDRNLPATFEAELLGALADPLSEARSKNISQWFAAGYGVGRTLSAPMSASPDDISQPSRDRMMPLFDPKRGIIGTGFADLLPPDRAAAFIKTLKEAFVDKHLLPHVEDLELRARGAVPTAKARIEAHNFTLQFGAGGLTVPATYLSQGYQAMIAWVADLIGQVWWEADAVVDPKDMEGIVLVDEIDLFLHPRWQAELITALKATFPNMQFICTTHSPMILPGLEEDEILEMRQDADGNVSVEKATKPPKLMTGTDLYDTFFGIRELHPRALREALRRYGYLAGDPFRSNEEDQEVSQLRAYLESENVKPGWEPVARESEPTLGPDTTAESEKKPLQ